MRSRKSPIVLWVFSCVALPLLLLFAAFPPRAGGAHRAPLRASLSSGIVATDTFLASEVAARVLVRGGNAVDAAVGAALTLGVAAPAGSGLGGGGFALYYNAKNRTAEVLDFRETAPKGATRDMYLSDGKPVPEKSR